LAIRDLVADGRIFDAFGIAAKSSATASRLIKETLGARVLRLRDPNAPPKTRRYLPHWA
jgi:ATP-dependent DNA helicase RecG